MEFSMKMNCFAILLKKSTDTIRTLEAQIKLVSMMAKQYEKFCPRFQCKKPRYPQSKRVEILFLNSFT